MVNILGGDETHEKNIKQNRKIFLNALVCFSFADSWNMLCFYVAV